MALDFSLIDDFLLASSQWENPEIIRQLKLSSAHELGPIVEFVIQSRAHKSLQQISLSNHIFSTLKDSELSLDTSRFPNSPTLTPHSFEFSLSPLNQEMIQDVYWNAFQKRLNTAAERAGFRKRTASGITGAFGELVDNILVHSKNPATGIVGYRYSENEFEMVVADSGIGVLESLRQHSDYSNLRDHGQALYTALSPGESRFGKNCGRGTGFNSLFINLASYSGKLRFRSGNSTLKIEGNALQITRAQLSQLSYLQGLVISIVCRPSIDKKSACNYVETYYT